MHREKPFDSEFGNYLLHGIDEVQLPEAVSWLPQTLAWKVLGALLALWACYFVYQKYRLWRANHYRRYALRQLSHLERHSETLERQNEIWAQAIKRLPELLKATALQAYPRTEIAHLSGVEWLNMLDRKFGSPLFLAPEGFSTPAGKALLVIAYQPEESWQLDNNQCQQLMGLARRWIKGHKVETGEDR